MLHAIMHTCNVTWNAVPCITECMKPSCQLVVIIHRVLQGDLKPSADYYTKYNLLSEKEKAYV